MDLVETLQNPQKYIETFFKVLTKADSTGMSHLVPMQLLPAQLDYLQKRTNRDVILKGRQMGLSTGVMAVNAQKVFTMPYNKMSIVTHNQDTSEFLLMTVQRFHRNLPDAIRPDTDWHSGSRMRFPKLDSFIHIDSAESNAIGIGETLNIVHCSELSRWNEHKAKDLFAGISQTVPRGGFITVESTPKGKAGLFYELYDCAKKGENGFKAFFYPWWYDPQYRIETTSTLTYSDEEKAMINHFGLTKEQIVFRRLKQSELGDLFYQEYPENDVDCWLAGEQCVFDGVAIRQYLHEIMKGREEGFLTVWKDAIGGEKYVIGVDVAGGMKNGDYSVASVLNVRRNEYVARLRGRIVPDLFAEQVMKLGHRYNDAEIAVERQAHGHAVIQTLLQNNYPNMYFHEDYDAVNKEIMSSVPGWKTSVKSKPIMIDTLASQIRAHDLVSYSENLCLEASGYFWDGNIGGKVKKSPGGFDDELDALMIAIQIRERTPSIESARYRPMSYRG